MKKLLFSLALFSFLALFLLTQTRAYSQNTSGPVFLNSTSYIMGKESIKTHSFGIALQENDNCISRFTEKWGKPVRQTAGQIIWEHKSVEGLGNDVKIVLYDGIFTNSEKKAVSSIFASQKEKEKKLNNLTENQCRVTTIEFFDGKAGKTLPENNLVKNAALADSLIKYLSDLLNGLEVTPKRIQHSSN